MPDFLIASKVFNRVSLVIFVSIPSLKRRIQSAHFLICHFFKQIIPLQQDQFDNSLLESYNTLLSDIYPLSITINLSAIVFLLGGLVRSCKIDNTKFHLRFMYLVFQRNRIYSFSNFNTAIFSIQTKCFFIQIFKFVYQNFLIVF